MLKRSFSSLLIMLVAVGFWLPRNAFSQASGLASCSGSGIDTTIEYTLSTENPRVRRPMTGGVIPLEADAIYLKLSKGLTGQSYVAYINKEGELAQHNEGYSNTVSLGSDNTIELTITKTETPQLFVRNQGTIGYYRAYLLEKKADGSYDKNAPKCQIIDYKMGTPTNLNPCNITLNKTTAGTGEAIVASVSNVNQGSGDYNIAYPMPGGTDSVDRDKSAKKVAIDQAGNGAFTFYAGQSLVNGAKVTVISTSIDGSRNFSCSTKFNVRNQVSSTNPTCLIIPNKPADTSYSILQTPQVVGTNLPANKTYFARITYRSTDVAYDLSERVVAVDPGHTATFWLSPTKYLPEGTYAAEIYKDTGLPTLPTDKLCQSDDFTVGPPNTVAVPVATPCNDIFKCSLSGGEHCNVDTARGPGIKTAIGCIHTNPAEFVKDFSAFATGIGGGIAFLMMLLGTFQMLTSAGNPEALQAGRERLTSAIIGLLFVIFATLLLQVIGFDILKLPGFGR